MRRRARKGGGRQAEVTVEAIGGRGDGLARFEGRPVFVPFTLPGDRARVRLTGKRAGGLKAEVVELIEAGPGRVEPPCPHFGPCGGCALQHLDDARYADWKSGLLPQALGRRGLGDAVIEPMIRVPPGSRRRASLAALRRGGKVRLGFHGRDSHDIVDLETCLLLTLGLRALLRPLRAVLPAVLGEKEAARIVVAETEAGPDVLLVARGEPDLAAREALTRFAEDAGLARLSWAAPAAGGEDGLDPEPLTIRRPPSVHFGGVAVEPPPGGFLQPTAEGEAALTKAVLDYLPQGAARVAELYAGCGTFTFPLSARARVHAVEGDAAALAALWAAARKSDRAGGITVARRDLARAPLGPSELAGFDAVVFDPPRAGAKEQAEALAESGVRTVIAISCNPNTFARDARILVDGGFSLAEAMPLDQFPWSGHLELAALFRR